MDVYREHWGRAVEIGACHSVIAGKVDDDDDEDVLGHHGATEDNIGFVVTCSGSFSGEGVDGHVVDD